MIRTLVHRAKTVISDPNDQEQELCHISSALSKCGYPRWSFDTAITPSGPAPAAARGAAEGRNVHTVLPYYSGLSEHLQRIFRSYGAQVFLKPGSTIRQHLVHPKDRINTTSKCGVVYELSCEDCGAVYVGETERRLQIRIDEHRSSVAKSDGKSAISDHTKATGHRIDWDGVRVIDQEQRFFPRKIREAIKIWERAPELNRDRGYKLAPVYQAVLQPRSQARL